MIAPGWTQLKIGRLIRRDHDPRLYHNLFRPTPPGYLTGRQSWWLRLSTRRVVDEPGDISTPPAYRGAAEAVLFRGERDHFKQLTGWDVVLLQELRAMTRQHWLLRADEVDTVPIAIHVRRGDFVEPAREEDFVLRGAIRTPLDWFIRCLTAVRSLCNCPVPALVVSDAPDEALRNLLQLDYVTRVDTGSAIGDLLVLSKAKLLIASGGSSFSAWAAFLGQMPAVAYPGQSLTWFKIAPLHGQYIGEWNHHTTIPPQLRDNVQRLGQSALSGVGR
jgi:hypothetical protein